jgi:hypothetical protein
MRKVFIFLLVFLGLSNCKKDSATNFDSAIIEDSSNTNKFKQLVLIINLKNSNGSYILLQKIDSINLKVNNKQWGTFASEITDTTGFQSSLLKSIRITSQKIGYLIIATYQLNVNSLETAGDYVSYLNERLILTPGDYVCEINQLKFTNVTGQTVIIKPMIFKDFKVVQNTTSSFVGEIEIVVANL